MIMTSQAQQAVYAAKNRKNWGRHAALRYVQRRSVHPSLYRLACQLEAQARLACTLELQQQVSIKDSLTDSTMYASMLLDSVVFKPQAI